MRVGAYEPRHRDKFRSFCCNNGQPGSYQLELFVRTKIPGWLISKPGSAAAWVVESDDGDLIAVALVELGESPAPEVVEDALGELDPWWFLKGIAVEINHQADGIGSELLDHVLETLGDRQDGGWAYWHVDIGNRHCMKMCADYGAAEEPRPASQMLATFYIAL